MPMDSSTFRLGELLFDNRVKSSVGWNLLPWQSTRYDIAASYASVCLLGLQRLGCPDSAIFINTTADLANGVVDWTCQCGGYDAANTRA